mgnify:CR=1 FL=1
MSNWTSIPPENIPEAVVKRAREMGADDVICMLGTDNTKQIRFANNSITASKSWASSSIGIFLTKDKKILATNLSDPSNIDRTLEELMKRIKMMKPSDSYNGIASGSPRYRKNVPDDKVAGMIEELYDHVGAAITAAQDAGASRVAFS